MPKKTKNVAAAKHTPGSAVPPLSLSLAPSASDSAPSSSAAAAPKRLSAAVLKWVILNLNLNLLLLLLPLNNTKLLLFQQSHFQLRVLLLRGYSFKPKQQFRL
jgi:hypothetical protein